MEKITKEYYTIDEKEPNIGLVMMVKDEEKNIIKTLSTTEGYVKAIIIYDTGSTDRTIENIQKYCEEKKVNLYLITGTFVDFSTSRNVVLEYAEKIPVEYLLLLDCNDELKNGEKMVEIAKRMHKEDRNVFLVTQEWETAGSDKTKYYNTRFFKNNKGYRYRGVVHEYLDTLGEVPIRLDNTFVVYQDRTEDNYRSAKRFERDREMLLAEYKKNPRDERTLFYLAQTCHNIMGKEDETLFFSKLRLELHGFDEERYHSYIRCAEIMKKLDHDWKDIMGYYMEAYTKFKRAEPLCRIAEYYISKEKHDVAYMFLHMACKLAYPEHCNLFVDKHCYDYTRWNLMGICAFYVQEYDEGKRACLEALKIKNQSIDRLNLENYEKKLEEIKNVEKPMIHIPSSFQGKSEKNLKEEFIAQKVRELKEKNRHTMDRTLYKLAEKAWEKEKAMRKI